MAENATRCLVCGRNFNAVDTDNTQAKKVQGLRMPEVTLSLPVAMGLIILILAIGAGVVFAILKTEKKIVVPTATATFTSTSTITVSPTPSLTSSPMPTATALPPVTYTVKSGDTCLGIAAAYHVSVRSIADLNNLAADCGVLREKQQLLIPQPTPTASPLPSPTMNSAEQTEAACTKVKYTVQANDTLSSIAANYNVSMEVIRSYNGLTSDTVYEGVEITIPLCERLPTAGPTPTETLPPPYAAPNLLLPADGASFLSVSDTITVQWASVGTLRTNEAYAITVVDVTGGEGRKLTDYVTDTKYIIPASFRPTDNSIHTFRWWVVPVRQTGTTKEGAAIWEPAGAASVQRVFAWWGGGVASPTP